MNTTKTRRPPASIRDHRSAEADPRRVEQVRAIFAALSKYLNAKTIYADNSPMVGSFGEAFRRALRDCLKAEKQLSLSIEQYQIKWHGEIVYDNREKKDSLAFLLYKDGVGEITFNEAVKPDELEQFVELVKGEICSSSPNLDIVSRLWQAEFTEITYRVFDECADGKSGSGRGSGSDTGEQQLRVNDHPNLQEEERRGRGNSAPIERSNETLGQHLRALIERDHPGAGAPERERHLQQLLESLFTMRPEELASWHQRAAGFHDKNKLLWLLSALLEFTRLQRPAPVVQDVIDIIDRLVRSIAEDADIPTLVALLELLKKTEADDGEPAPGFETLPQRIRRELTSTSFLLALGKKVGRSRTDTKEILAYFRSIGTNAVPALRDILASSTDPSIHAEACDALVAIAREYITPIIEDLKPDNPLEAQDAIRLLRRCATGEVPPVIEKYLASPLPQARAGAAGYLAQVGTDEAAQFLCRLLADGDADVRIDTLAAIEELRIPSLAARVTSMCFEEDLSAKSMKELERLFRTAGKIAGESILPRIRSMAASRGFFRKAGSRARQNKLLAVTALRCIPGQESRDTLDKLARDRDKLVRSMAQRALSAHGEQEEAGGAEKAPAAAGGGNDE